MSAATDLDLQSIQHLAARCRRPILDVRRHVVRKAGKEPADFKVTVESWQLKVLI